MTTPGEWLAGARPRTLPAAVAPVLVGSGVAAWHGAFRLGPALLALVVGLAVQVGVNYANDYSDGVRGTDADRVGPMRLVGSGAATPTAVRNAALASFGVAAVAGLALALITTWWLLPVGAVAILAAWTYTGGPAPYGYRGLGEVSVFVFFGLVAVAGTAFVQVEEVTAPAVVGGVVMGTLACAILVVNNLRDRATDAVAGKRTLAVVLGDHATRVLYVGLVLTSAGSVVALAGVTSPWAMLGVAGSLLAIAPTRVVLAGTTGPALVPVLRDTGRLEMVVGVLLTAGLVLGAALA